MQPILNIVLRATRQANEYLIQSIDKFDPNQADASSSAKQISHIESTIFQILFDHLKKAHPNHFVLEPGEQLSQEKDDVWQLSSIHSPGHLLRKLPTSAYSIVHKHKGKIHNAIVINPITGDEYVTSRGSGASLNGRRIRVSSTKSIEQAFISTNLLNAFDNDSAKHILESTISELSTEAGEIAVNGCDVLDLVRVASGQFDACALSIQHAHELEAASLICQECGVLTGTFSGAPLGKSGKTTLIAANPKLFKSLVMRLNKFEAKLSV